MTKKNEFAIPESALRSLVATAALNLAVRKLDAGPGEVIIHLASAIGFVLAEYVDTKAEGFTLDKSNAEINSIILQTFEHCKAYKETKH